LVALHRPFGRNQQALLSLTGGNDREAPLFDLI